MNPILGGITLVFAYAGLTEYGVGDAAAWLVGAAGLVLVIWTGLRAA